MKWRIDEILNYNNGIPTILATQMPLGKLASGLSKWGTTNP
jgi:hypothetical protein